MSNWQSPPGPGQQPYKPPASSFYGPPQPPKSSAGLWIALAMGGILLLVCGGGCMGLLIFGMNISEQEIITQLRDNPKLREHIGEIQSLNIDLVASSAQDESEVFVYNVKGNKGSGTLTIHEGTSDDFETLVEEATLRLPDGTQVQIVP